MRRCDLWSGWIVAKQELVVSSVLWTNTDAIGDELSAHLPPSLNKSRPQRHDILMQSAAPAVCKCSDQILATSCRWEPIAQRRPLGVLTCGSSCGRSTAAPAFITDGHAAGQLSRIVTCGAYTTSLPRTPAQPYRVEASAARIRDEIRRPGVMFPIRAANPKQRICPSIESPPQCVGGAGSVRAHAVHTTQARYATTRRLTSDN